MALQYEKKGYRQEKCDDGRGKLFFIMHERRLHYPSDLLEMQSPIPAQLRRAGIPELTEICPLKSSLNNSNAADNRSRKWHVMHGLFIRSKFACKCINSIWEETIITNISADVIIHQAISLLRVEWRSAKWYSITSNTVTSSSRMYYIWRHIARRYAIHVPILRSPNSVFL